MGEASSSARKNAGQGPHRARRGVLGTLLYWAPVWIPATLIAQIVLKGLKPTQAEARRLDRVEQKLSDREERLSAESALHEKNRRMLADPIYQERVRKSIHNREQEPLDLVHDLPRGD